MAKPRKTPAGRRDFLKGVVAGAATLAAGGEALTSAPPTAAAELPSRAMPVLPPPTEADPPAEPEILNIDRCGSDFMVDVIKTLNIDLSPAFRHRHSGASRNRCSITA